MTCARFFNAVSTAAQILTANSSPAFNTVVVQSPCVAFTAGGNSVTLPCKGVYYISFDADVNPTVTGTTQLTLTNNGTAIPGGVATFAGTADTIVHIHVQGVVPVRKSCECVDNTAIIQVLANVAATVTNANLMIERIG